MTETTPAARPLEAQIGTWVERAYMLLTLVGGVVALLIVLRAFAEVLKRPAPPDGEPAA